MSVADEIVEGESCQYCQTFTGKRIKGKRTYEGWGFPVLCRDCAMDEPTNTIRKLGKNGYGQTIYQKVNR